MERTCGVAIVDDHALVALAIGPLIESAPGLRYLGAATGVADLRAQGLRPDLVVLDLLLRDGSAPVDNVRQLNAAGAEVLVLTSGENRFLVREALRTPALGVVRKSAPAAQILAAITQAAAGQLVVDAEWAITLDDDPEFRTAPLTDREHEVLSLYASGIGAKQVASLLEISQNTVNDHLKRIKLMYQRLGRPAPTKVDLYRRGIEDGFIPVPDERA
ncbi:response regulator transcription factor [Microbacterium sp. SD291]|uniref:LuxR C-terminal-related transcriptional regulator n=1 Tax=Microbacterium sp. SD291 TaxID=2782007 RepID=UPI001A97509A|nr:response regulator transcription factor [Microbacterium sp. SD291]MBO0982050.1 response regulator transcription factor [Microbacterium sp. SD291]